MTPSKFQWCKTSIIMTDPSAHDYWLHPDWCLPPFVWKNKRSTSKTLKLYLQLATGVQLSGEIRNRLNMIVADMRTGHPNSTTPCSLAFMREDGNCQVCH